MATFGVVKEAAPDVRPAEGERSRTALPVRRLDMLIGAIAVALDDASEVPEQLFRPDFPATRHVSVDDRRWIGAAMRAIITDRKSDVEGKRVSVSVDIGVLGVIKKKTTPQNKTD